MTIVLTPGYSTTHPPDSDIKPCIPSSKEQPQWYYTEIDDCDRRSEADRIKRHGNRI